MSEPLSWLTLERYALGELPRAAAEQVRRQLADSPEDRARLQEIETDSPQLLPLPVPIQARRKSPARWLMPAMAAAAALWLVLLPGPESMPPARRSIKGGDVALQVVGERSSEGRFAQGERFKVRWTCPPGFSAPSSVRVFQGDEVFEPLGDGPGCGNLRAWPGAFALDGQQPVQVCVTWGQARQASRIRDLGEQAVCQRLTPIGL